MATGETPHWDEASVGVLAGGSTVEAVGGAAALVLAIIGLAAVLPMTLTAVATIAIGVALLAEGAAIAARYERILARPGVSRVGAADVGGGMSAEFFGGAAGIVLGVLALLGVATGTLEPIAAIVFGGALLFGSTTASRLERAAAHGEPTAAREAVAAASGAQVLVGLGSAVLGILAVVGIAPETLTLVALLSVGAAVLLSGSALTARMAALLHV